ncbi:transposase [Chryseobacterium sp. G0240]|uniref:helix-turn-helix domain-containing protein n=1 Tax=Chryseobacterium sp. G0240 TaxID=2487066 RepID=UPI000F4541DD|nr:helix-turn-helix domain-containing protein [Chryseobacterium sp. G0240]ROI06893.1 transposase [Chryseobacterium sp. G0240]
MDFKDFHLGKLIKKLVDENDIDSLRISKFLRCSELDIQRMYEAKSLNTEVLLRWSKLLDYDFFRLYSQHLILFSPRVKNQDSSLKLTQRSNLPQFKKNIYTKQVIDFILEEIASGTKTRKEIMEDYNIPKATLYRWVNKYGSKIDE